MIVADVAVAAPVHKTYSYEMPGSIANHLGTPLIGTVGTRVFVPFGNRKITGYILDISNEDEHARNLKEIYELLDETPLFHPDIIPLFKWVADYYHYPLGKVIQTALPGGLTVQSRKVVYLSDTKNNDYQSKLRDQLNNFSWIEKLLEKGKLSASMSRNVLNSRHDLKFITRLVSSGIVTIRSDRTVDRVKKKTEICYRLEKNLIAASNHDRCGNDSTCLVNDSGTVELSKGEKKTLMIASTISEDIRDHLIPRKELIIHYPYSRQVLPGLIEKGLLEKVEKRIFRTPYGDLLPYFKQVECLTDEQSKAVKRIRASIDNSRYITFLLHGITGSGKTEVYLRAAQTTLKQGKSVLVLVPEIALATQIEAHFVSRFGNKVALMHSGLTAGERYDEWTRIYSGDRRIVIGARSAVFAPLRDIGLIIVDEEHDTSFKQEDQLRYNSRDIAILRGRNCQAVTVLGSATPSITSYYHALSNKFELIEMKNRVGSSNLPGIQRIDLKDRKARGGGSLFSDYFVSCLKETFNQGSQSILLMNRRGFSASVICRECGTMVECRHCNVTLNMHKSRKQLVCHYCGFQLPVNVLCKTCGSSNLVPVGFGTERVEEEVLKVLPEARIARLDSDVAADRKKFMAILQSVREHEIDILVGTQMIAKGLHFPEVTLVGVVWADGGLAFPDFKAAEKTYQLIAQVTGRAGRGEKAGRVIIQTMQPDHYSIRLASEHDYTQFVNRELEIRRGALFPPFVRLVSIRVEGEDEQKVKEYTVQIAACARQWVGDSGERQSVHILGPAPAPIERIRDTFRWQFLIKAASISLLHDLVQFIQETCKTTTTEKVIIDVDPENML